MTARSLLLRRGVSAGTKPTKLPIHGRNDLAMLARELNWRQGAEIGVWKGAFSALLLQRNPQLHLLCVDPWVSYPAWRDGKNNLDDPNAARIMEQSYQTACAALAPYTCTIVRKKSAEAAVDVPDGSLDFVYIDGNHVYEAVTEDLTLWTPKVKPGGVICGHDYRRFPNKPYIHVVDAVNDFTKARGIDPWFVLAADRTPSFLWEAA